MRSPPRTEKTTMSTVCLYLSEESSLLFNDCWGGLEKSAEVKMDSNELYQ